MAAGSSTSAAGDAPTSYAGAVLGMGNPLLDISAETPMEFLEKYDVKLDNAILAEDKHVPMYKEMVEKFDVTYIAGGATQNSVRVAQWMLQEEGATTFVGSIGEDEFGEKLDAAATGAGVKALYRKDPTTATGTCAVLVHKAERSLVANLAAANNYAMDHYESDAVQAAVKAAKFIYSAGFFLTVCPDAMVAAGKVAAASRDAVFGLNLSAPFLCQFFKDQMHAVLPYADYVFGNESEAAAFAEANGFAPATSEEVALHIAALPKASGTHRRTVVITQGSRATVVAQDGKVTSFPVTKIPREEIVDANGAGDAFVGGFIAAIVKGAPIDKAVAAGTYSAGQIIRASGCAVPKTAPTFEF